LELGKVPLSEYKINLDKNPQVIQLKPEKCIDRIEKLEIKYLKPKPIEPPGDLIITEEGDYQPPEAPPIIIRIPPEEHCDPKPLVIRERPPQPPKVIPTKEIIMYVI
jgi:hypothetical protein